MFIAPIGYKIDEEIEYLEESHVKTGLTFNSEYHKKIYYFVEHKYNPGYFYIIAWYNNEKSIHTGVAYKAKDIVTNLPNVINRASTCWRASWVGYISKISCRQCKI